MVYRKLVYENVEWNLTFSVLGTTPETTAEGTARVPELRFMVHTQTDHCRATGSLLEHLPSNLQTQMLTKRLIKLRSSSTCVGPLCISLAPAGTKGNKLGWELAAPTVSWALSWKGLPLQAAWCSEQKWRYLELVMQSWMTTVGSKESSGLHAFVCSLK